MRAWEPDRLEERRFAELVAPLFEDAPRFIGRLAAGRPYGSWASLFDRAVDIALDLPADERIELIDAHPRIGAAPGSVSALSYVEQGYDRDAAASAAEAEGRRVQVGLDRLNRAYEATFGFRYVIFVAGRPRSAIVPLMAAALEAERGAEMERALRDVVAIARDRAVKTGLMAVAGAAEAVAAETRAAEAGAAETRAAEAGAAETRAAEAGAERHEEVSG